MRTSTVSSKGVKELIMASTFEASFGALDMLIFIGTLIASAAIGVYFAYKDRTNNTTENYMFGGGNVSPIAVGFSIGVSYISAITVVSFPVETYLRGVVFLWISITSVAARTFIIVYIVPYIHNLDITTIYMLYEIRFSRSVRMILSILANVHFLIYMSIAVYLPSLALNSVTPIPLLWSIFITTAICTFYTTMGGIKAVVWTDALQAVIMFFGMLSVFLATLSSIGGFGNLVESVERSGRNNFWKANTDPRERNTIFTYLFGFVFIVISSSATSQVQFQRILSCKTVTSSRIAIGVSIILGNMYMWLAIAVGVGMYAYTEGCDLYKSGLISKQDQAVPYMASKLFRNTSGLTGLFVAAAYSGTLSTVSSGVNSIASSVVNDYLAVLQPHMKPRIKFIVSKIFSGIVGGSVLVLSLIISKTSETILNISFILDGCVAGPTVGVFFLAAFVPLTNTKGALAGLCSGIAMTLWVGIGKLIYGVKPEFQQTLPVSIDQCNHTTLHALPFFNSTETLFTTEVLTTEQIRPLIADTFYSISPFYVGTLGVLTTMIVAIIASLITEIVCVVIVNSLAVVECKASRQSRALMNDLKFSGRKDPKTIDPQTFVPLVDNKRFSPLVRKFFRFGVPEIRRNENSSMCLLDNVRSKKLINEK